jgi:hypothetical protein
VGRVKLKAAVTPGIDLYPVPSVEFEAVIVRLEN